MSRIKLLKKAVLQKNEGSVREKGDELEVNFGRASTLVELGIAKMIGKKSKQAPKIEQPKEKVESAERKTKVDGADRTTKDVKPTVRSKGRRRARS